VITSWCAADIVKAAKANDAKGVEAGQKKWHTNADDIADLAEAAREPELEEARADRHCCTSTSTS
jgi:hypothetical protein